MNAEDRILIRKAQEIRRMRSVQGLQGEGQDRELSSHFEAIIILKR